MRYCPGNHESFQTTDMACQNFEGSHLKSLHPGRMNYLGEYLEYYLLCSTLKFLNFEIQNFIFHQYLHSF